MPNRGFSGGAERSNLHEYLSVANFAFPDFGSFPLAPAGPVFQPDMPAMPAADHLAGLHHAFAERKPKMGAEVLNSVNLFIPLKQCDVEPVHLNRMSKAFAGQF